MKKVYVDVETKDGRLIEQTRIVVADRQRGGKAYLSWLTAQRYPSDAQIKAAGAEDVAEMVRNEGLLSAWAWAATTRLGLMSADGLESWLDQVLDIQTSETAPETDPTRTPEASTMP